MATEADTAEFGCWIRDLDAGTSINIASSTTHDSGPGFATELRHGEIPVNGDHGHQLCVFARVGGNPVGPYCSDFLP